MIDSCGTAPTHVTKEIEEICSTSLHLPTNYTGIELISGTRKAIPLYEG